MHNTKGSTHLLKDTKMKKLLLGITIALTTLTATLYAACTADVDMGNNKITNLSNGIADGDAVNYEQALKRTLVDIPEDNASKLASVNESHNVAIEKVGGICILVGQLRNVSGTDITSNTLFGTIPEGYRPVRPYVYTSMNLSSATAQQMPIYISRSNGSLTIGARAGYSLVANGYVRLQVPYTLSQRHTNPMHLIQKGVKPKEWKHHNSRSYKPQSA
jgi:hypothetical protein